MPASQCYTHPPPSSAWPLTPPAIASLILAQVRFGKFNVGKEDPANAIALQPDNKLGLRSLPTFRFYRAGRCFEQVAGVQPVRMRQILLRHT